MLLRSCFSCDRHEVREEEGAGRSFCRKENCWSRYSKCLAQRAVKRYIEEDRVDRRPRFSAIAHLYGEE